MPPNPRRTSDSPRSGKSRENFLDPCAARRRGFMPPACARTAYIKVETFRQPDVRRGGARIAGTLAAPRFRPGWSALCVSVGTAVDDAATGQVRQQAEEPARESPAEKWSGARRGIRNSRSIDRGNRRRTTDETRLLPGNKKSAWQYMGNKNERPQHGADRKPRQRHIAALPGVHLPFNWIPCVERPPCRSGRSTCPVRPAGRTGCASLMLRLADTRSHGQGCASPFPRLSVGFRFFE